MLKDETPNQYYERMRQARRRYLRYANNGQRRLQRERDAERRQAALARARQVLAAMD